MIIITNEVIPENLVVVLIFEKFTSINLPSSSAQRRFIEANFSELTHNNQIFRNEFVCSQNHFSKISVHIIECKILTSLMLLYI